jgi:NACalpha-BTF3-like transcription factor
MSKSDEHENKPADKAGNKEAQKAAKAAASITDYYNEKDGDTKKAAAAVASLTTDEKKESGLFEGEVADKDLAVIVEETDLPKDKAEKLLRRNNGSVSEALQAFIQQ